MITLEEDNNLFNLNNTCLNLYNDFVEKTKKGDYLFKYCINTPETNSDKLKENYKSLFLDFESYLKNLFKVYNFSIKLVDFKIKKLLEDKTLYHYWYHYIVIHFNVYDSNNNIISENLTCSFQLREVANNCSLLVINNFSLHDFDLSDFSPCNSIKERSLFYTHKTNIEIIKRISLDFITQSDLNLFYYYFYISCIKLAELLCMSKSYTCIIFSLTSNRNNPFKAHYILNDYIIPTHYENSRGSYNYVAIKNIKLQYD